MGAWTDFVSRFRRKEPSEDEAADYIDISPATGHKDSPAPPLQPTSWLERLRPGAQRERQIAWLQAGYSELLTLMRGIHDHLRQQEDVQHKMADVLTRLPDSMDGLRSVGRAAEQQVEVLALLRKQLDSSTQHDQQLIESMNRFNQTLGVMDETSRTSGRTVAQFLEKSRDSEQLLQVVIERSERRFIFMMLVFVVALVASIGTVFYVMRREPAQPQPSGFISPEVVVTMEPPAIEAPPAEEAVVPAEPERRGFLNRMFHREPTPETADVEPGTTPEETKP